MLSLSNESYRKEAYSYYFQQVICTVSLLDDLLQSLKNENILDDATIIIHGDHGSIITIADPVMPMMEYLESRDLIDSFSTLFALRSGSVTPGYDSEQTDIQSLFSELILDGNVANNDSSVYLLTGPLIQKLPLGAVPIPEF
jgi:arylsulfatase A-like enzyme